MDPTNTELANPYDWCIAGGWAACPQLATDQDVWILGVPPDSFDAMRNTLVDAHPEISIEESDTAAACTRYGDLGLWITRVGVLPGGNDEPDRHIMLTDVETPEELLTSFDISTHQCAITSDMRFVKGVKWTPITVKPVKLRQTEMTDERFAKIWNRYGRRK